MIIPLINLAISLITSFCIMFFIGKYLTTIVSVAPELMMSICIAISFDYSLFLLSRYQEEKIKNKRNSNESVKIMLKESGKVVFISGFTLTITFLGLITIPTSLVSSIGIGTSCCIFISILNNLTLTPSLLLAFDWLFNFSILNFSKKLIEIIKTKILKIEKKNNLDEEQNIEKKNEYGTNLTAFPNEEIENEKLKIEKEFEKKNIFGYEKLKKELNNNDEEEKNELIKKKIEKKEEIKISKSFLWWYFGNISTVTPLSIIIILLIILFSFPVAIQVLDYKVTTDFSQGTPRNSEIQKAFNSMSKNFSPGFLN